MQVGQIWQFVAKWQDFLSRATRAHRPDIFPGDSVVKEGTLIFQADPHLAQVGNVGRCDGRI